MVNEGPNFQYIYDIEHVINIIIDWIDCIALLFQEAKRSIDYAELMYEVEVKRLKVQIVLHVVGFIFMFLF